MNFELAKDNFDKVFEGKKKALEEEYDLLKKKEEAKFESEKANLKRRLISESNKKLDKKVAEEEVLLKQKLHKEFANKINNSIEQQKNLSQRQLELNKKDNERKILELKREAYEKEKAIINSKKNLEKRLGEEKRRFNLFNFRRKKFEKQAKMEEGKKIKEINEKLHNQLKETLKKKEEEMRNRLQGEFDRKLSENLKKQREDLLRKKSVLEKDLKRKVEVLLK
jgi:hypothetical protein